MGKTADKERQANMRQKLKQYQAAHSAYLEKDRARKDTKQPFACLVVRIINTIEYGKDC